MKILRSKKILFAITILVAIFLRFYKLSDVPVSLFGDELDVGYHAFSILKTGRDYMGNSWPLHFQSLAEYRTPLYLYSVVPTVAIFGISPLGVRIPAAFFGVLSIIVFYFLIKILFKNLPPKIGEKLALIGALVMTFSPWHIQYSRAAFEVTQMLFFLLLGFYMFFLSIDKKEHNKYLWISALSLGLAPWVYSTAKLFVPMIVAVMLLIWFKDIMRIDFKHKRNAIIVILVTAMPMVYEILIGQSSQRFDYISVFTDPVIESEIGYARDTDLIYLANDNTLGAIERRFFHNKYLFWGEKITSNVLRAYSTDFLFIKGDINLRHSIEDIGEFYRIEIFALIIGLIYFFVKFKDKDRRVKLFLIAWFVLGVIPSAITRDGGDHSTRLFLLLPAFIILIAHGINSVLEGEVVKNILVRASLVGLYSLGFIACFILYQHQYWIHNPWYSERWWHAGYKEAIQSIKAIQDQYNTVYVSNASEPPWIFFAAWYEYPPAKWQAENPIGTNLDTGIAFNNVSYIDKFRFGQVSKIGIYTLGQYIDSKTLYMAAAREVGANLIQEPGRTPAGLELVKAIPFPSGEPAFYLFKGLHETPPKDPFEVSQAE